MEKTNVMNTIERLCKYKDLTDIVYKHIHQMHTKEMIAELKMLSTLDYTFPDSDDPNAHLLFSNNSEPFSSCFNWRTEEEIEDNEPLNGFGLPIFKISHKKLQINDTNAFMTYKY